MKVAKVNVPTWNCLILFIKNELGNMYSTVKCEKAELSGLGRSGGEHIRWNMYQHHDQQYWTKFEKKIYHQLSDFFSGKITVQLMAKIIVFQNFTIQNYGW